MPNSLLKSIARGMPKIAPCRRIGPDAAHARLPMPPDEAAAAGAVALAAFNGAAIGFVGCVAAALRGDSLFALVALSGAALCLNVWHVRLSDDDLREPDR
jgi:hypothetical protein